jgi:PAS domain S-box-containing protein
MKKTYSYKKRTSLLGKTKPVQTDLLSENTLPKARLFFVEQSDPKVIRLARQQLYQQIIETANEGIWMLDEEFHVSYLNRRMADMLGYQPEEILGQSLEFFTFEEDLPELYENMRRRRRGERAVFERKLKRKDGTACWVLVSATPVFDNLGQFAGSFSMLTDISDRKQAEQVQDALFRISEATHQTKTLDELYHRLHQIIATLMPAKNFYIALYNEVDNLLEFPYYVDEHDENPGLQKLGKGLTEYILRTGQPLLASPERLTELIKLGEVELISAPSLDWLGVPLKTAQDQIIGALVVQTYTEGVRYSEREKELLSFVSSQIAMAIERKRAESLLRSSEASYRGLLNSIEEAIYIQDQNGYFLDVNQGAVKMYGYPRDFFVGQNPEIIAAPGKNNLVEIYRMIREASSGSPQVLEFWGRRCNGDIFPMEVRLYKGHYFGRDVVIAIAQDITDRKQFQETLIQSRADLFVAYEETLKGWARALELRERETAGHSQRVVGLTLQLAQAMGIKGEALTHIQRGALLHDIGKLAIPDHILLKTEPLTKEEWVVMRLHPVYAYDLLSPIEHLYPALDIPYCHHEHWDGSGYPRGLRGEEIPLAARIFAVVDVWDAMTSERPYRPAWSAEYTSAYIREQSGKLFDPQVVDVFLSKILLL